MRLGRLLHGGVKRITNYFKPGVKSNILREASYIFNSDICWGPVKVLEIETTSYCPAGCIMCPKKYNFKRQPGHMPIGLFKKIIKQLEPEDQIDNHGGRPIIRLVHYGEPCLYPNFYDSIKICKDQGLYTMVSSTASLFTRDRMREAIGSGLDQVWMMVDGMDEDTSTRIRGPAAPFNKSVENIHAFIDMKRALGVSHPIINVIMIRQPANAHQWKEFTNYWSTVKGVGPQLAYFSNFGGDVPEINNILRELQATDGQPQEDKRVSACNRYRCFYPWHSVSILNDGRVVPCCRDLNGSYILGDLNEKSLKQIWNDEPIRKLRNEFINRGTANLLCRTCNEANNEIGLPWQIYPGVMSIGKIFPHRYRR
ncbi:MAG: SPASM domain-containing protein [Candidatus Omnitrophota bacterium]